MSAAAVPLPETCFHCGLDMPEGLDLTAEVLGAPRPMCCIGCMAVAEMLEAQGLAGWYENRTAPTGAPAEIMPDVLTRSAAFEIPEVESQFTTRTEDGHSEATLLVEGLTCAACVWIIEHHLERLDGVARIRVNLVSHRAVVTWDTSRCDLRDIIVRLAEIGFTVRPDRPDLAEALEKKERRAAIIRLGVAGLGTMNVMTYAVGLYLGLLDGMESGVREFLRWLCLLVTTPVILVAGRPFFSGAYRSLLARRPGMDVPVALAIGGAFAVSTWAVIQRSGDVYFESICMFIFFLQLGRFAEMEVRHSASDFTRRLRRTQPDVATRIDRSGEAPEETVVPVDTLIAGDHFRVRSGERAGVDGQVVTGSGRVEESMLSGEPWPRSVEPGDTVAAGSIVAEGVLEICATRVGTETTLSRVIDLVDRAQAEKPEIARRADRVASVFVSVVLGIATLTAIGWSIVDPSRVVWVTLAVLVATCPCALGLATPAALAVATQALAEAGLLVRRSHVLEGLSKIDAVVFDKTGTLTKGTPSLVRIQSVRGDQQDAWLAIARELEIDSPHPFAKAFRDDQVSAPTAGQTRTKGATVGSLAIEGRRVVPGFGVEGRLEGRTLRLGQPRWALDIVKDGHADASSPPTTGAKDGEDPIHSWIVLADEDGICAWFGIDDPLRSEAQDTTLTIADMGMRLELLSGDPGRVVERIAGQLAIPSYSRDAQPDDKLARLAHLHDAGERLLVVGDGMNDGPALRAADVSIAMGSGTDLAHVAADAVLLRDDLGLIPRAILAARRTQSVVKQNLIWAIAYNACALPLAIAGLLAPWAAALGMTASSLAVVLNSVRLGRSLRLDLKA